MVTQLRCGQIPRCVRSLPQCLNTYLNVPAHFIYCPEISEENIMVSYCSALVWCILYRRNFFFIASFLSLWCWNPKHIKFIGLQIDNHLICKNRTEQMIPVLHAACYAIRSMDHISSINILKSIYYVCFHSIIRYGKILWGNSSISGKNFTLQKKFMRIMAGAQPRTSYRSLWRQLEIRPVPWQHIFS